MSESRNPGPRPPKPAPKIMAEICLYGTPSDGAGWLAMVNGEVVGSALSLGDGQLKTDRTFTHAIWEACDAIRASGVRAGLCWVFAAGGKRMTEIDLSERVPYYGDLDWEPAPVHVLDVDQIIAAAQREPIRVGDIVKLAKPAGASEREARYAVEEINGDRALARLICDLPIPPIETVRVCDLER